VMLSVVYISVLITDIEICPERFILYIKPRKYIRLNYVTINDLRVLEFVHQ
jgi:hypothetical protein